MSTYPGTRRVHPRSAMKRWVWFLAAGTIALDLLAVIFVPRLLSKSYDRYVDLARAVAALTEPWRAPDRSLDLLTTDILARMTDESLWPLVRRPSSVLWADFAENANRAAGRYDPWTDTVMLNQRYRDDPAWRTRPWVETLIHELVHAQGIYNEAATEALAVEILAAMANEGYPGAYEELMGLLQADALVSAWWMAAYEHDTLPSTFDAATGIRPCDPCPRPTGDTSRVDAAIAELLPADSWRRMMRRRVWWLDHSGNDFEQVLGTYVAPVIGALVAYACEGRPFDVQLPTMVSFGAEHYGTTIRPTPVRADDVDIVLAQAGYCWSAGWERGAAKRRQTSTDKRNAA